MLTEKIDRGIISIVSFLRKLEKEPGKKTGREENRRGGTLRLRRMKCGMHAYICKIN